MARSIEVIVQEARESGLTLPADAVRALRALAIPLGPDHEANMAAAIGDMAGTVDLDLPPVAEPDEADFDDEPEAA